MREHWKRLFPLAALLLALLAPHCRAVQPQVRGVWVSTVLNLDYPSAQGLDKAALQQELDQVLDTAEAAGFNAVFFQVRPCADSFYPSQIFPYSVYLTGQQGQSPDGAFDPLAYLVEQAHARQMQVHAWINPYRVTQNSPGSLEAGLNQLAQWHPARQDPSLVRLCQGNLYFDPGLPQVRELIVAGAREIVQAYPVDGIHLDDYFYPSTEFDDAQTYAQYGGGLSLDDFRRQSVDQLIQELGQAVHEARPGCLFGVSPAGIWANASSLEGGSDTRGNESYFQQYADSRKWVQQGWLDYIAPQLYWYSGQPEADFSKLLDWWCGVTQGTGCQLWPGLAAYKAMGQGDGAAWQGTAEIESQLAQIGGSQGATGCILFRYGSLTAQPQLLDAVAGCWKEDGGSGQTEQASAPPTGALAVSRPTEAIRTHLSSFYFCGVSDPAQPLTINGQTVLTRAADGSWGVLLPLEEGRNTFTIQNGGDTLRRYVLRQTVPAAQGAAFPLGDTYQPQGQEIPLALEGRAGGQAVALFCGQAVPLSYQDGAYRTQWALPGGSRDQVTAYGSPLYVVERHGFVTATFSTGQVYQIGGDVSLGCRVETDLCDVFAQADSSQGSVDVLRQGMEGPVDRVENGYAHCRGAGYLRLEDIQLFTGWQDSPQVLPSGAEQADDEVRLTFSGPHSLMALCRYENSAFTVTFPGAVSKFPLTGDVLAQSTTGIQDGALAYTFTLKDFTPQGYYWEPTPQGATLVIRQKAQPSQGLEGVEILLDAGHGGSQSGTQGCGPEQPEKQVNLRMAQALQAKLEALGAQVRLTRQDDSDVTLRQRYQRSFDQMPDLFLSLHCNSAPDDADLTGYQGVTAYCSGALSQPLAQSLAQAAESTGRAANPAVDDSLLYLCRQPHTTAILLENGYLPNPYEYSAITSDEGIDQLTEALAQAILEYYSKDSNGS